MAYLVLQNVHTKLHVRLLQLCYKAARETCDETLVHALELYGRTVTGEDDALAVAEQMVEDVEEGVLCALLVFPFLYVVHDKNVYGLVEIDKVVDGVAQYGVGILHLEEACADIEHSLFWVYSLCLDADGVDEVCLSAS